MSRGLSANLLTGLFGIGSHFFVKNTTGLGDTGSLVEQQFAQNRGPWCVVSWPCARRFIAGRRYRGSVPGTPHCRSPLRRPVCRSGVAGAFSRGPAREILSRMNVVSVHWDKKASQEPVPPRAAIPSMLFCGLIEPFGSGVLSSTCSQTLNGYEHSGCLVKLLGN